jgi:diguanylate cyclase (GGDEF)-like protein
LRKAAASVLGSNVPIYGGGSAGIITNNDYGYAGDQVGIACIWLDKAEYKAVISRSLSAGEEETGSQMGQELAQLGIDKDSPVMLFYDAVSRDEKGRVKLKMAATLLNSIEKSLGFLPNLTGAGLMGDHECTLTQQFIGSEVDKDCAAALAFSGDIRIDNVIMHGCRPSSVYYTVTKADGPVILEINHKPALTFTQELLGSAVKPEDYPFFLLFGVNYGERWGEYDEDKYASRLCLGIDYERNGIVMFEPDMVEGTEFQIMFRSFDLDYMKPKIESLFSRLNGRKPVFAIYIDCAGRCAGYGGTDLEDALVIQQLVGVHVPVLGLYTGVEIAPVAGRPRGLDWTGVLCLFSQGADEPQKSLISAEQRTNQTELSMEILNKMCEQNTAKILSLDLQTVRTRYELELKRRGFHLLSGLSVSLKQMDDYNKIFIDVSQKINAALNMQKTLVLAADSEGVFHPVVLQGFSAEEQSILYDMTANIPKELLGAYPVSVTSEDSDERFAELRSMYKLPFFIAATVFLQGEAAAVLITGRTIEQPPYFTRLSDSDRENVHAVAELLGSVLTRMRLLKVTKKSETDGLTGLFNRSAFQSLTEKYLKDSEEKLGAFIILDVDKFKSVNDTYGHKAGDTLLKECAYALKTVFRDSDIICRLGGDEFAIFCPNLKDRIVAKRKAAQIAEAWKSIIPEGGTDYITASIGAAFAPEHGITFEELYSNADSALYVSKENGRNRCTIFE